MAWSADIELELRRGDEAERIGNDGRARTCARRAVGLAVSELKKKGQFGLYEEDFMRQVRRLAEEELIDSAARAAAGRLAERLTQDFRAAAIHPMEDARTILRALEVIATA